MAAPRLRPRRLSSTSMPWSAGGQTTGQTLPVVDAYSLLVAETGAQVALVESTRDRVGVSK